MRLVHPLKVLSLIVLTAVALASLGLGGDSVPYETPEYEIVERIDSVEIREYAPYLAAETTVDVNLEKAGNQGFPVLAKYIFGGNRSTKKNAMTSPVTQKSSGGEKIAMTAPVTQKRSEEQYVVQFLMPSEYSKDELPVPNDARINIREVTGRRVAAIRYSGTWSKRNYEKHLARLIDTLRTEGYAAVGEPTWARYNPPFTPWFLRRNEIMTEFRVQPVASRE